MPTDDLSADNVRVPMPANMLAQIDAQVGSGFMSRDEFVRSAVRHYLEYLRALDSSVGEVVG